MLCSCDFNPWQEKGEIQPTSSAWCWHVQPRLEFWEVCKQFWLFLGQVAAVQADGWGSGWQLRPQPLSLSPSVNELLYFNIFTWLIKSTHKGLDASSDGYDDDNSLGSWFRAVQLGAPEIHRETVTWLAWPRCRDEDDYYAFLREMVRHWDGSSRLCAEAHTWYVLAGGYLVRWSKNVSSKMFAAPQAKM